MLDRITEIFVEIDDFCKQFFIEWEEYLLSQGKRKEPPGPACGLSESKIMTIIILHHSGRFKYFKNFYEGIVLGLLKKHFPGAPCYDRFIAIVHKVIIPMSFFMISKTKQSKRTGIYYIDSTQLPVCHNLRGKRHKVFKGLAAKGKTSTGWFFGLKLHLVFNDEFEIVAVMLTRGNVSDTTPVPQLTKNLIGKLFGDKGYIGKKLTEILLSRGLQLMTRVRKNMKSLPMSFTDKMLLNTRNMAETVIGHIKAFSSLNLPKHRSAINAFVNICAAIIAYLFNPIQKQHLQKISYQLLIS